MEVEGGRKSEWKKLKRWWEKSVRIKIGLEQRGLGLEQEGGNLGRGSEGLGGIRGRG